MTMPLEIHICKPRDTTETLCGLKAARVAALNYSERMLGRGPFCKECEKGYQEQQKIDKANPDF